MSGEHKTPEYRARVGVPHVPALELDDGTTISESVAIGRYLESMYPEPNLFGVDAREQAIDRDVDPPVRVLSGQPDDAERAPDPPGAGRAGVGQQPQVADYNRVAAERFMRTLDRHLADHAFIAADRFTIADIVGVVGLDFARLVKYRPPEELAHLARWLEDCRARPAAKVGV